MGWSDSPLRTLTLPQDASSSDPRIVIGPDLPSTLVNASPFFTWTAAIIFWFNDTDYKYEAIGWYNDPVPESFQIWAEGTYDTVHGFIINAVEQGPGSTAALRLFYGSDAFNSTQLEFTWRNALLTLTDTANLYLPAAPSVLGYPGGYVNFYGQFTAGTAATSAGPEVAIASAAWASEPFAVFLDNHVYKIDVQYGIGETGAIQIAPTIRLRKGAATIVGQVLGGLALQPVASALAFHQGTPFTAYVANVSGADISTELSLTVSGGVAGNNIRLYGSTPPNPQLNVVIQEIGYAVDPVVPATSHALLGMCTNIV